MPNFEINPTLRAYLSKKGFDLIESFDDFGELRNHISEQVMRVYSIDEPYQINSGYCFIWAFLCSLYSPEFTLVSCSSHAVVKFGGYHWDHKGSYTNEWWEPVEQTPAQFVAYWEKCGRQKKEIRKLTPALPRKEKLRLRMYRKLVKRPGLSFVNYINIFHQADRGESKKNLLAWKSPREYDQQQSKQPGAVACQEVSLASY